jgi:Pyruvate/2-oxoacid:ferredoxin oxidoreductase gamma subunit
LFSVIKNNDSILRSSGVERELLLTGIGGQGVQLAAQLLAKAATTSGRYAQLFGSYGGMMRGGNTDATLIIGDRPVQAPPMVSTSWSALVMHHEYAEPTLRRVQPDGLVILNSSIVTLPLPSGWTQPPGATVLSLPASDLAIELGAAGAATMVALGAYTAVTGLLDVEELVAALPGALPSYRQQHVASSANALRAGTAAGLDFGVSCPAWAAPAQAQA